MRILIVDADRASASVWKGALEAAGHAVEAESAASKVMTNLRESRFNLILLSLSPKDEHGHKLLAQAQECRPRPSVVVLSEHFDSADVVRLYGQCNVVIPKPVTTAVLLGLVSVLQSRRGPSGGVKAFCREHRFGEGESRVLELTIEGLTAKGIANTMGCEPGTVTKHWARIFNKTGARSQRDVLAALLEFKARRR